MRILSIETSCDETAISILDATGGLKNPRFSILGDTVASQIEIHKEYGGVFPALAKREHIKNLPIVFEKVLKQAKIGKNKKPADAIAVTVGPGLEPALWTGIVFAKELAQKYDLPLIPINHMEGHVLSVLLQEQKKILKSKNLISKKGYSAPRITFPALALLISGGHTELVLVKDWMQYKKIGATRDDAVGEAFDKVARMLDLPYPGGPQISKLAELQRKEKVQHESIKLPRPMIHSKDFDFSFSGLKTAVMYLIRDLKKENPDALKNDSTRQAIALEFENAATEVLVSKTIKAIKKYKIQTLIVGGGVSANKHIKAELSKAVKTLDSTPLVYFPQKELSTDNSIMIGIAGYFRYLKADGKIKKSPKLIKAQGNLSIGKSYA
jgi:N6-L-threonylcarbamoyladenine synthase